MTSLSAVRGLDCIVEEKKKASKFWGKLFISRSAFLGFQLKLHSSWMCINEGISSISYIVHANTKESAQTTCTQLRMTLEVQLHAMPLPAGVILPPQNPTSLDLGLSVLMVLG